MIRSTALSGLMASALARVEAFEPQLRDGLPLRDLGGYGKSGDRNILVLVEGEPVQVEDFDEVNDRYGFEVTEADVAASTGTMLLAFQCCHELPMFNVEDMRLLGKVTHCYWAATHDVEGTQGLTSYDIFDFGDGCGAVAIASLSSLAPFSPGFGDGLLYPGSDQAGYLNSGLPPSLDNQVMAATTGGRFEDATGTIRISGALAGLDTSAQGSLIVEMDMEGVMRGRSRCLGSRYSSSNLFSNDKAIKRARQGINGDPVMGHASVQFLGASVLIGDLSAANDAAGLEGDDAIDVDDALPGMGLNASDASCYSLPMVDTLTKKEVGTGIDCLWFPDGGVASVAYFIAKDGDLIVNSGTTSVQGYTAGFGNGPVLQDGMEPNAVAMTGSHPADLDANTFLATTGKFSGYQGNIRLSGAVAPGDPFYFSCMWIMNLEIPVTEGKSGKKGKGDKKKGDKKSKESKAKSGKKRF